MKPFGKRINDTLPKELPIIPTMDVVVFPNMIVPLLVLDERIISGVNKAAENESKMVLLLASKKQVSNPQGVIGTKDLYEVGTVASIMRLIKLPEGGVKVLVQGVKKAAVKEITADENTLSAEIDYMPMNPEENSTMLAELISSIKAAAEKMSTTGQSLSPDFYLILSKMQDPEKIADFLLSHLTLSIEQAQALLQTATYEEFLEKLYEHLLQEAEVSEVQERIKMRARDSMNKSQKEFYLREQLRAIKKELGDDELDDVEQMKLQADSLTLSDETRTELHRQINRLEKTTPDSMEASVIRTYIDWFLALPWNKETEDNFDLARAREILDEDHYGLKEIKERILDFMSVRALKKDSYAPILCFFGPPGTGKTSLGKSIARSLGREYFRVSLGGVKDEAEIRGHRRTYVGAMPGRFIQGLKKAGSSNPVIIIDELDKIGSDFRGDPSAAMLEILDPAQNKTFYDNYLGVPFDFSKAIFIATANSLDTISAPLRDRMEIIQVSGYTREEKMAIAERHLIRRALEQTGLESHNITFSQEALEHIISYYTREAGVREFERLIKKMCCKVARSVVENSKPLSLISRHTVETSFGPKKYPEDDTDRKSYVGVTNGLAWTTVGGELLKIEAVVVPGRGKLTLTGQLGDVMRESAQAALSYIRAHAEQFGIPHRMFTQFDIHVHLPAGAIPKDGPSAGITILTSILSALTQRPINADFAMTGELNLRGNVMPIGGVKEKLLAAKRNNISHVILPRKNQNDMQGIEEASRGLKLIWVEHADEVINKVLMTMPKSLERKPAQGKEKMH